MTLTAILIAIAINVLWGGTYVAVKLGLTGFPPLWSAFLRFAIGLICVLLWARILGLRLKPSRSDWPALAGLSSIFTFQIILMNYALTQTGAGITSVLLSAHPLFAALLAHWLIASETLSARKVAGLALAFGGTAYVMVEGRPNVVLTTDDWTDLGNWLALASAAMLGTRFVVQAQMLRDREPALVITWLMTLALPVFLVGALVFETIEIEAITWLTVGGILYQGVVIAGLGFMTLAYLLKRYAATTTISFGFINPISGVALAALILGEPVTSALLIGCVAVALGLILIAKA